MSDPSYGRMRSIEFDSLSLNWLGKWLVDTQHCSTSGGETSNGSEADTFPLEMVVQRGLLAFQCWLDGGYEAALDLRSSRDSADRIDTLPLSFGHA